MIKQKLLNKLVVAQIYWQMYGVFKSFCHSVRRKFSTQMATLQQDSDIITVIILSLHSLINQ